tara:strand:+ start:147 stop:1451 length:1305 start_codon:yes stop_codon:yes gene_type:complete
MLGSSGAIEEQPEAKFLEAHKHWKTESGRPSEIAAINEKALRRFEMLGYPQSKHEMFTFVNVRSLGEINFVQPFWKSPEKAFLDSVVYEGCEKSHIALVDGVYSPELSNLSAVDNDLETSVLKKSDAEYLQKVLTEEDDPFSVLNGAFFSKGLSLNIKPKVVVSAPIQITVISTGGEMPSSFPRILIRLGELGELKVIVRYVGVGGSYFVNSELDAILGDGSGMTFTQIQEDETNSLHFSRIRLRMGRNSRFHSVNASSGCRLARHHYSARLEGEGAEFNLKGVNVLIGEEQAHYYVKVFHSAPSCVSNMHFKNIVNDKARSSVDGTVIVEKDAQLTNSDQLINSLILSDNAHADSKPNLIISADDVKCTHGNTVGQIDEEQMFYLKTRGLHESVAKTLLTQSFAASIVKQADFPAVRKHLENILLKKLVALRG